MSLRTGPLALALAAGVILGATGRTEEKPYTGASCSAPVDAFFADEVWAKVGARVCLTCHKKGGDAEDSTFILRDPRRAEGADRDEVLRHNRNAFARMAGLKNKDQSR